MEYRSKSIALQTKQKIKCNPFFAITNDIFGCIHVKRAIDRLVVLVVLVIVVIAVVFVCLRQTR